MCLLPKLFNNTQKNDQSGMSRYKPVSCRAITQSKAASCPATVLGRVLFAF